MYTHIHLYIQYSNTSISKFFKVSVLLNMLESVTAEQTFSVMEEQTFMIYTYIHIYMYTHTYILTIYTYKCIKILKSQRATQHARCSDCRADFHNIHIYIYTYTYIHILIYTYTYNIQI